MANRRYLVSCIAAVVIPVFELCAFAFAAWVFTSQLCIHYLLDRTNRRTAACIIILVFFWLLFLLALAPLFQNFYTLLRNPPYVKQYDTSKNEQMSDKSDASRSLEHFWNPHNQIAYSCEGDGLPHRCAICSEWKPDRAHHSSDLGRCVERMDHFCPWFGGVVGSTNHKFFLQFIFWTAVWCLFGVIVLAIFIDEQRKAFSRDSSIFVPMIVCIALQALFLNFTGAMTWATTVNVCRNKTDIEAIQTSPWVIAINVTSSTQRPAVDGNAAGAVKPAMRYFWPDRTEFVPANIIATPNSALEAQAFAVITAEKGENPFDLGSPLANFRSVMGTNVLDWFLPLRGSPATLDSWGPLIDVLAARHNLSRPQVVSKSVV